MDTIITQKDPEGKAIMGDRQPIHNQVMKLEQDLLNARQYLANIKQRNPKQQKLYIILTSSMAWKIQIKLNEPAIQKCEMCYLIHANTFIETFAPYIDSIRLQKDAK